MDPFAAEIDDNDTVFVSGLPTNVTEEDLASYFGQIGVIKFDKKRRCPKIWLYKDKHTGELKGEATVTYDDPFAAHSSVNWFNGKDFNGQPLKVVIAEKPKNAVLYANNDGEDDHRPDRGRNREGPFGAPRGGGGGGGGGRGGMSRPGDWTCSECGNTNWARRDTCNKCHARKSGGGGGGGGGGENRYRGGRDDRSFPPRSGGRDEHYRRRSRSRSPRRDSRREYDHHRSAGRHY